ncbi:MAG: tetratricopeptide repeat protein [Acidobacteria bacterium]|nr:tetratricopeptide repeat protein [Acidobacteriota bacterium]MBI3264647.1 tetratricopeptide repeat protein [Acidobacteriota bacterium]
MRTWSKAASPILVAALAVSLSGCTQLGVLKARKAFKEANAFYTQQEYKRAAEKYEEAIANDPNLVDAYFFLANSYDNLYKPSRRGEKDNDQNLQKAVEQYKVAAERSKDLKMKRLALEYLVASYGADKLNDPAQAIPVVEQMIKLEPNETTNYFALARIFEDMGEYEKAEQELVKAREAKPNDSGVYMQLAGFYNRQGQFDKTIEALTERSRREPTNPEAFYTIATYYWDKAYRDFTLKEPEKKVFVSRGIEAIDKAISIKADYMEALVYKNLLLRSQALLEKDPKVQQNLLKQADQLRDRAQELRKQKAAGVGSGQ